MTPFRLMDNPTFDNSRLPPDLDDRVRAELRDGERLLWVGQPQPARFARQAIPIVLFGLPWTAFAVFWTVTACWMISAGNDDNNGPGGLGAIFACFPLFGLPFVLIGIGMLSSPYWLRRQAKRTCYALTDRRVILLQAGTFGSVTVRSYGPEALGKTYRNESADGIGDLIFDEVVSVSHHSGSRLSSTTRHGFMAIERVREIEELLRRVLLADDHGRKPAE